MAHVFPDHLWMPGKLICHTPEEEKHVGGPLMMGRLKILYFFGFRFFDPYSFGKFLPIGTVKGSTLAEVYIYIYICTYMILSVAIVLFYPGRLQNLLNVGSPNCQRTTFMFNGNIIYKRKCVYPLVN